MGRQQRALVTGANSGVGAAVASRLARAGYAVTGTFRNESSLARGEKRSSDQDCSIAFEMLDVRDAGAVDTLAAHLLRDGPIDLLVNNAGVAVRGPMDEADEASIALAYETNVFGPMRLIRALAPAMRAARSGAIVNVSSVSGFIAQPFSGLYASTKFALEGFTESLYWELKPFGIRVALLQLGRFDTPIHGKNALTAGLDDSSGHWQNYRGWWETVEQRLYRGPGGDPALVADTVLQAVETNEPRLRWLVGADAEGAARLHAAGSFEDYERTMRLLLSLPDDGFGA
jgi:NAD(P)-dependent dehydrogenase (short-subunit alcohol dehydrogenase family)